MEISVSPLVNQTFVFESHLNRVYFIHLPIQSLYLECAANTPSGITRNLEIIKVDQVQSVVYSQFGLDDFSNRFTVNLHLFH